MTEDDTFRKLKQVPFSEALVVYHSFWNDPNETVAELKKVGWTYKELSDLYPTSSLPIEYYD